MSQGSGAATLYQSASRSSYEYESQQVLVPVVALVLAGLAFTCLVLAVCFLSWQLWKLRRRRGTFERGPESLLKAHENEDMPDFSVSLQAAVHGSPYSTTKAKLRDCQALQGDSESSVDEVFVRYADSARQPAAEERSLAGLKSDDSWPGSPRNPSSEVEQEFSSFPRQSRHGSVQFSTEYDRQAKCLTVTVLSAHGLRNPAYSTYIKVHLLPHTKSALFVESHRPREAIRQRKEVPRVMVTRTPSRASCQFCVEYDASLDEARPPPYPWQTKVVVQDKHPNYNEKISFTDIAPSHLANAQLMMSVKSVHMKSNVKQLVPLDSCVASAPKSTIGRVVCQVSDQPWSGVRWLELEEHFSIPSDNTSRTAGDVLVGMSRSKDVINLQIASIRDLPMEEAGVCNVYVKVKFAVRRDGENYVIGSQRSDVRSLNSSGPTVFDFGCHRHLADLKKMVTMIEVKERLDGGVTRLIGTITVWDLSWNPRVVKLWTDAYKEYSERPADEPQCFCKHVPRNLRWLALVRPDAFGSP